MARETVRPIGPDDSRGGRFSQNLAQELEAQHAECRYEGPPSCEIAMHPARALQVLQNLISNACKFRRPDLPPQITLTVHPSAKEAVISLSDNGIGMPEEGRDQIFKPFHRLTSHRAYEGSGVGLATCARLIQAAGGTIQVASKLGEGTTFLIRMPRPPQPTTQRS